MNITSSINLLIIGLSRLENEMDTQPWPARLA